MLLVTGRELIVASDSLRISISLDPLAWETGRGGGEEGGQGGRREAGEREERGGGGGGRGEVGKKAQGEATKTFHKGYLMSTPLRTHTKPA